MNKANLDSILTREPPEQDYDSQDREYEERKYELEALAEKTLDGLNAGELNDFVTALMSIYAWRQVQKNKIRASKLVGAE